MAMEGDIAPKYYIYIIYIRGFIVCFIWYSTSYEKDPGIRIDGGFMANKDGESKRHANIDIR